MCELANIMLSRKISSAFPRLRVCLKKHGFFRDSFLIDDISDWLYINESGFSGEEFISDIGILRRFASVGCVRFLHGCTRKESPRQRRGERPDMPRLRRHSCLCTGRR